MIGDYVRFAFGTFRHSPVRSWLTMIGIFIGIAAVVALVSIGHGLTSAVNAQFEKMGTDKIIVSPGSSVYGAAAGAKLHTDDRDVVKKVSGVKLTSEMIYKIAKVQFNGKTKYIWVYGIPTDEGGRIIEDMQAMEVINGRDLKSDDRYKALVGSILGTKTDTFGRKVSLRDNLLIEDKDFRVVGILDTVGNPDDDSATIIPLETAKEIFGSEDEISMLFVQVQEGFDVDKVAEGIKKALRKRHGIKEGEEDFTVQTTRQFMDAFNSIFMIIQAVVFGIAAISLVVGGIGIMNTMYTAVIERTPEIGVMKAVGAKNSDIAGIFLVESGLLGLFGGAIGILLGIGISKIMAYGAAMQGVSMLKAVFPWPLIAGALAFSLIIGALSGTLPALQAAKLKPVDALRYE